MNSKVDYLIIGGGLAGALTAYRLATTKPSHSVLLIEKGDRLGGQKTFSFHESDLTASALEWIRPLIAHSWKETSVLFPRLERTLEGNYHSFRSEDLHRVVSEKLGKYARLKTGVVRVNANEASLETGEVIQGRLVLDARGPESLPAPRLNGFQKFVGFDLLLEEPHGLTTPLLMDATCPQLDGFRFFYLLPLDEKRILIEETFYSDSPEIYYERNSRSIRSYAERRGWKIAKVEREESGVLTIPMTSDSIIPSAAGEALPIGTRGGYFHATTGYSLPDAARTADFISNLVDPTTDLARDGLMKFRRGFISRQRFYRLLNRLLFCACEPSLRYTVLQQFYEQPVEVIERFYAGRTTWSDRLRILSGRPPVPLNRAFKSLSERSVQARVGSSQ